MASLTPGILQKLLQNAGNKDFKVAGEHRTALLQVISIVPSLEDDPWKSRGYFLRVSDSLHSAYVSVSDEDVELILSDKVQLGQFIHVTRLDSGSPVPVLRGIKPIPKRRPCVGDPKDLISSDFLNVKKVEAKVKSKGKVRNEEGNIRRLSFSNGKVGGGSDGRRLSLDSARKGWDSSALSKSSAKGASKSKLGDSTPRSDSALIKKVIPMDSPKSSSISSSPLQSKNVMVSPKLLMKPVKSIKSSEDDILPSDFKKVSILSSQNGPHQLKISWNALPSTVCDLGKDVQSYRDVTFASAVRALEEASICEDVVRCMSMFTELCELSRKETSGPLVEQFLNIHERIKKASKAIITLINTAASDTDNCSSQGLESEISITPTTNKNASLWVQAAIQTDFSKFSLYTKGAQKGPTNGGKSHYILLENTPEKTNIENHSPKSRQKNPTSSKSAKSRSKNYLSTTKESSVGSTLKSVANLARKLLSFSRAWFLDYLEDSLKNGFGLGKGDGSQVAVLLGQLKRVNHWLDDAFEGDEVDERIERLRKTLYRFLLDHVDSAVSQR